MTAAGGITGGVLDTVGGSIGIASTGGAVFTHLVIGDDGNGVTTAGVGVDFKKLRSVVSGS